MSEDDSERPTDAAAARAKAHYAERYHIQMVSTPDNYWLYGYLAGLGDVDSVFEFGCNAGRHLAQLKRQGMNVAGMDINTRAIEAAQLHHGLELLPGDESALSEIGGGAYDAVMTVSVLSHMPDIERTLAELRRIARRHVLLVETRTRADSNNFWWVHDYPGASVHCYHAGQVNAIYQVWHERKSS